MYIIKRRASPFTFLEFCNHAGSNLINNLQSQFTILEPNSNLFQVSMTDQIGHDL